LKLRGQEKGLVVNATNFDTLADVFGSDPSKWPGHTIVLKGEKVLFKGKRVDSIRVIVPEQSRPKPALAQTKPSDEMDDEIPDDFAV
jgi:hypothetical protein